MAKGAEAKSKVVEKIIKIFGDDYIGEFNNKYYVWSIEDGVKTQVCIALSCPKNPVGEDSNRMEFAAIGSTAPQAESAATIGEDEKANIANLMKSLGL